MAIAAVLAQSTAEGGALLEYMLHAGSALLASGGQVGSLLVSLIALAFLVDLVAGLTERLVGGTLGPRVYLIGFAWLGTAVHELSHVLFCVVFGHKVTGIKLFTTDPYAETQGYVRHSYRRQNVLQAVGNLFIGVGPIIGGVGLIVGLAYVLLGPSVFSRVVTEDPGSMAAFPGMMLRQVKAVVRALSVGDYIVDWRFYVFLYLVLSVGSSIRLSKEDILGALEGLIYFFALLTLMYALAPALGVQQDFLSRWFGRVYGVCIAAVGAALAAQALAVLLFIVVLRGVRVISPGLLHGRGL